ncbi:MAG: hypothetical protein OEO21_13285, partial [Candidatus Krumholzibacteria bacterium]|nr:hypothetical protein [Candidatus Krumholzibacteria bacterium]
MKAPARFRKLHPVNLSPLPSLLILAALLVLAAPGSALALTTTWTGGGATDDWSDAGNWNNGVPGNGDNVTFMAVGGNSFMDIPVLMLTNLDMRNFSGVLHLMQLLFVTNDLIVEGDIMANTNLAVGGNMAIEAAGSLLMSANVDVGGDLSIDGGLAANGYSVSVGGSVVVGPSGILDITASTLSVVQDFVFFGPVMADAATVAVGARIEGFAPGTLTAVNASIFAEALVNFETLTAVDMTGGDLLLGTWADELRVGPGHTLGSVTIQGQSPSFEVFMRTTGAWTGLTGNLTVTQGTLDLRNADLIVQGSTTVASAGTIRIPSVTSGHTHEFRGGVTINSGAFRATSPGATIEF